MSQVKSAAVLISLLGIAVLVAQTSPAGEIYKWTDENGNVHYEDRPSGAPSEERVLLTSRPTNPAAVEAQRASVTERRDSLAETRAAAAEMEQAEEQQRAEAREREERCATYRQRLERFVQSRRLYREDENGERVYLNDEEMREARQKVQQQVEEYCSP